MIRSIFVIATTIIVAGLALLISLLPTPETSFSEQAELTTNSLFINDIAVFDGRKFHPSMDVAIKDGLIAQMGQELAAPDDLPVIEGSSMTLIPGLIDAHTHSFMTALNDALRFGVTAHLDMFTSEYELAKTISKRQSLQQSDQADLFSSGTMATVDQGHGTQYGFPIDTVGSIDEAEQWVSARKQAGADYIKLVYMPYQNRIPSLDRSTASAIIKEAKKQQLMVLAHISKQAAAKDMIEEGIDGLVHVFADSVVEDNLLLLAKEKGVFIIPTLSVIAGVDGRGNQQALIAIEGVEDLLSGQQRSTLNGSFGQNIPGIDLDIALQNVKQFFDAGVPILAGSDAPNPGTAYGVSTHGEMQLLVEAGLTAEQALIATTSLPAQLFELEGRGQIAEGARADLLLLHGNPLTDITQTLHIASIYKNGFKVDRNYSKAQTTNAAASALLGNFEGGTEQALQSQGDMQWTHSDDSFANGKSTAQISVISTDEGSSALQVKGEVNAGFPYPWAGAAIGDFAPPVTAIDASGFTHVVFDVKGKAGNYRIMAFDAVNQGIPPYQTFEITEQWQTIEIKLEGFKGFEAKVFSGLSFVAGPSLGEFHFVLDNVRFE